MPPRVLILYFSYTQQSARVARVIEETLRARGVDVAQAAIEFTDARYAKPFSRFPLRHAYLDVFRMTLPQLRRATGEIQVPDIVEQGDYDLVCVGSPTWWLTTSMPVRSFLKSEAGGRVLAGKQFAAFVVCRRYWRNNLKTVRKLGAKRGGKWLGGIHFAFAGGQIHSFLALVSYLGKGENRERYLGVRIPPTNLQPDFDEAARSFASHLADRLDARRPSTPRRQPAASGPSTHR
jgi:menaquinone-dependent protoporphyrinogen IX oxidase